MTSARNSNSGRLEALGQVSDGQGLFDGYGDAWSVDKGWQTAYFWNRVLPFTMPRTVTVQIWQLGLMHKVLMCVSLIYVIWSVWDVSSWAYKEQPSNRVNAWTDDKILLGKILTAGSAANFSYYCNASEEYSFVYDATFVYNHPKCEPFHEFEYSVKRPKMMYVPTVYMDVEEQGWACNATTADSLEAECTSDGGSFKSILGVVCLCTHRSTTFPIGVESLELLFSHTYQTTDLYGEVKGSSSVVPGETGPEDQRPLETRVKREGQDDVVFESGDPVGMTIADWLAAAGIDLDARNEYVSSDANDATKKPFMRTTGISIELDIDYTNVKPGNKRPSPSHKTIHAEVTVSASKGQWAGLGADDVVYTVPRHGVDGHGFKMTLRYSQGIVFTFRGQGWVFKLDYTYLVTAILSGIVLLGVAKTITIFVAMYLWPTKVLIRNKVREKLAVGTRLAEIGLKAISYASSFHYLDEDKDGVLKVPELLRALAWTGHQNLTAEQARAIATMVIKRSNEVDDDDDVDDAVAMDFAEYMSCMEAGQMLHFDQYKVLAAEFARKRKLDLSDQNTEAELTCFNEEYRKTRELKSKARSDRKAKKRPTATPSTSTGEGNLGNVRVDI